MANDPKHVRDYAAAMARGGRLAFVEQFRGHVLLGLGFVAKVSERPANWQRRTLNSIEPSAEVEEGPIAQRVWRVQRAPGAASRGRARITIGQASDNDIVLPEYTVSGHHCAFIFDIIGAYVMDLDSLNGTFIGDTPLPPQRPTRVKDGNEITIARIRFRFLQNSSFVGLIEAEVRRLEAAGTLRARS